MATTRIIICKDCRKKTSIDNVRYDKTGKELVCITCYSRTPSQQNIKQSEPREKMMCLGCNYKFGLNQKSKAARRCPYCASENITPYESVTAKHVLEEVTAGPGFVIQR
jgi:predicted Zn-ribbon and HTH transcriptional regulator